jgi:endogenous inhibitor of DNA gyrase (YacG/DUF329 family)
MKCPICKKDVTPKSEFFPFCIDLGNWASEKYVISTPITPPQSEEDEGE